uniref:Ubiquitin carboxyl-terminal hydrolase 10 n=1 Tax=Cajanus cajan TaxID=3821 RepID=A0A151U5N2_CAJCA|nr:Ubiquitin carboxyl-terminal hydrolase 10 [Cajanus cajan]
MTIADSVFPMDSVASCIQLPPEEENRIVSELIKESELNLKDGNVYFVISNRWFSRWQSYVGSCVGMLSIDKQSSDGQDAEMTHTKIADRPGPIDNSDIISKGNNYDSNNLDIHRMLEEGADYVLVPEKVWERLLEWYKGGPALPRKLISQGLEHKQYSVEVYPLSLKVIDARDNSQSIVKLSKKATIGELHEQVCKIKGVEQSKACIWDYFNFKKHSLLTISDQTLEEANLTMDQDILLEVSLERDPSSHSGMDSMGNELALVPLEPTRSSVSIAGGPTMSNGHSTGSSFNSYQGSSVSSSLTNMDDKCEVNRGERGGLAGLQNLGNTCFMNSSIQCLVHTPQLVEYFLQDYSEEINMDNPLGMHGELALAFGDLLRKLWSSGRTAIAPRSFKSKLARFAPQFSGYNQHDSQELLAFLLDGLHEDLNRVKQKPYIEMKDSDGRPDEEVASECWKNHMARNDSLIVDVCQGQYKSTLVCPVCGKISITFDPFMYLSLPLPSTVTRMMTVTVFYCDGSGLPMPYTVSVLKHGCCRDLCQVLGTACCLKSDEMLLLAEVYEHKIYRYLENPLEPLSSIKDDEHIVAYRVKSGARKKKLEIMHRWLDKFKISHTKLLFGASLFLSHSLSLSSATLSLSLSLSLVSLHTSLSPSPSLPPSLSFVSPPPLSLSPLSLLHLSFSFHLPYLSCTSAPISYPLSSTPLLLFTLLLYSSPSFSHLLPSFSVSVSLKRIFLNYFIQTNNFKYKVSLSPISPAHLHLSLTLFLPHLSFSLRSFCTPLPLFHISFPPSPSLMKGGDKKLFGTPLVTYLVEDPQFGANIEASVHKLLAPLRRAYSSTKSHDGKENGFISSGSEEQSNISNTQSESQSLTFGNKEQDGTSCGESSFQLALTNENCLSCEPIEKSSFIKSSQLIRVFLDWTEKEHEVYDASYLRDLPEVHKTVFTVKKTKQEAISLFSCLEAFLTEEPLGPDDMWYCPRCKEHRQATKKLDLWKLPEILVFHLKRFSYSRYLKNKLDTFVNFPIHNLDLTKYVKSKDGQSYVYDLYAVSNHYGGLGGGHYTAYCKLIDDNKWCHFDDSHVTPVTEAEIKSSAAYVLFYQRVRSKGQMEGEASQLHTV